MSRILKRPMFRKGGSPNKGIMTGLVERKQYKLGSVDREQLKSDTQTITDLLNEYAPIPTTKIPYGGFGIKIASGVPVLQALGEGYDEFRKKDDATRSLRSKRNQGALSTALQSQLKKPTTPTLKQGVNTTDQVLYGVQPGKTGYFTPSQIISAPGAISPIDSRMAFTFDTENKTLTQMPISERDRINKNKSKATEIVASVGTVGELKNNMIGRLQDTPTGAVGSVFSVFEGISDQFSQATQALGFNKNSLDFDLDNSEKLDKYLESKGVTRGAANFVAMKSSVTNLAYMLAKIKEPGNPKLSEGDIIRQMDRIKFGASRDVFIAGLNQIYEDELIGAKGQIKGYGLNPDNFFNTGETKNNKSQTGTQSEKKDNDPAGIR